MEETIENLNKLVDSGDIISYHTRSVEHFGQELVVTFDLTFPSGKVLTVDYTEFYGETNLCIEVE